jgi:hypothetical protein
MKDALVFSGAVNDEPLWPMISNEADFELFSLMVIVVIKQIGRKNINILLSIGILNPKKKAVHSSSYG